MPCSLSSEVYVCFANSCFGYIAHIDYPYALYTHIVQGRVIDTEATLRLSRCQLSSPDDMDINDVSTP